MADVLAQTLIIERGEDASIVLSGTFTSSPVGWAVQFSICERRGATPVVTVTTPTIVIAGSGPYTATIPLSGAQTSLLLLDEYDWDLWRTDVNSVTPKAGGSIQVVTPCYPPVSS